MVRADDCGEEFDDVEYGVFSDHGLEGRVLWYSGRVELK